MSEPISAAATSEELLPIVYINLDSDPLRRERMEAEFARLGLPGRRSAATRWTELDATEQARYYSASLNARQFHTPLINGQKGCYTSHLRACQWLLDSPHAGLIVLEDDVVLRPEFNDLVRVIAAQLAQPLAPDWDMIKLIGRAGEPPGEQWPGAQSLIPGFYLVPYRRIPSFTAGYVVSRSGARKLLDSRMPFGRPIDVDLRHWWENDLCIRGIAPHAVSIDPRSDYSTLGTQPAVAALTRWRRSWRKFRLKARYSLLNLWHSH